MSDLRIALLRGINVGGNKMVSMADLRAIAERLGLREPKTLLQSGNLVFRSSKTPAQLEAMLERELDRVTVMVRTCAEWQEVVAGNPFAREAKDDPARLVVMAFKKPVSAFEAPGREVVRGEGRHLYIYYPDGQGTSKLMGALIERRLGTLGTARNWNTVMKLAALCVA